MKGVRRGDIVICIYIGDKKDLTLYKAYTVIDIWTLNQILIKDDKEYMIVCDVSHYMPISEYRSNTINSVME